MKIVADSSPWISFAILERLNLLPELYSEIYVPYAVPNEISNPNKPHAQGLTAFCQNRVVEVKNQIAVAMLMNDVDIGEAEAIVLALETGIPNMLIDDAKGRRAAQLKGLQIIGTIGILLSAKKKNMISKLKPELDSLVKNHIRIGQRLYTQALRLADEA